MRTFTVTVLVSLLTLALTSCMTAQRVEPLPSATPTALNDPAVVQDLYGDNALFLSEFLAQDRYFMGAELQISNVLFEKAGIGPNEYALPALATGSDQLLLAIFCDEESAYEVAVVSDGETIDRTWAEICGNPSAPGLATYITAPITADSSSLSVKVTVDRGVSFRVSVFEANVDEE